MINLLWSNAGIKGLKKVPNQYFGQVFTVLVKLCIGDKNLDTKSLSNKKSVFRIRVGKWRIQYEKEDTTYIVLDVFRRERGYK